MSELYDRQHVESVLKRVGAPKDRRDAILNEIQFPIDLKSLQERLAPFGVTHAALTDRMGGSP